MRPFVSVVLPFHGTVEEAQQTLAALACLTLRDGDEVIVVDNTPAGTVPAAAGVRVVRATAEQSAYHARNVGADAATTDWLLLLDSDCHPRPDLADRFFDAPVADDVGALVGEVVGRPGQEGLVPRYARSRGHLGQRVHIEHAYRPWGVTANMLVRRAAWADVGGFLERIRSTGDAEFSWRIQDAGWRLEYRPAAVVEHEHRDSVAKLARQAARYGAGRAWIRRRYPGSMPRAPFAAELARAAAGIVLWTATGRLERATFKALDGLYVVSHWGATWLSNTPPGWTAAPADEVGVAVAYPAPGDAARVEAVTRPVRVDRERAVRAAYAEDDGVLRRLAAAAWLIRRAPRRTLRFLARRPGQGLALAAPARRVLAGGATRLVAIDPARAQDLAELTGLPLA